MRCRARKRACISIKVSMYYNKRIKNQNLTFSISSDCAMESGLGINCLAGDLLRSRELLRLFSTGFGVLGARSVTACLTATSCGGLTGLAAPTGRLVSGDADLERLSANLSLVWEVLSSNKCTLSFIVIRLSSSWSLAACSAAFATRIRSAARRRLKESRN